MRRTGATAAHDASSRRRLSSPAADASRAACAIARGRARPNPATAPALRLRPQTAPLGEPHAMAVYKPPAPGRPIHVPRGSACPQTAYPCGFQACQKRRGQLAWRHPTLGNPGLRAVQPRLGERAPVVSRREAENGAGEFDAKILRYDGIADAEGGKSKTGPQRRARVVTRLMG